MFLSSYTPEGSTGPAYAKTRSTIVYHRVNNYYIYVVDPPEAGLWRIPDCNNIDSINIFSVKIKEVENRAVGGCGRSFSWVDAWAHGKRC
jgi:hypothetical protein